MMWSFFRVLSNVTGKEEETRQNSAATLGVLRKAPPVAILEVSKYLCDRLCEIATLTQNSWAHSCELLSSGGAEPF